MSAGLPRKHRNREITAKSSCSMLPDLSTNPKLWDLILPRDLSEWETELDLIDTLCE
jgi:hypothetical protein